MDYLKLGSRIAGGIAAAMVVKAAHTAGTYSSAENVKIKSADRITNAYISSRRLDDRSVVTSKLKDKFFQSYSNWSMPDKINAITGYIKGFFEQGANDAIPAFLATGALLSKKLPKLFGLGLGLYAIKYLLFDIIDIGRTKSLK